jgi:kynureninase
LRTRADFEAMDAKDPLRCRRDRFALPDGLVYLDGNSLGALPKATAAVLQEVVQQEWGRDLITSWNRHGWIDLPRRVGAAIARLIGAGPDEVVVTDSISINLFKLACAALRLRPGRRVVLSERGGFPTDLYMIQGLSELMDGRVELRLVAADELEAALDADVALLMLNHVDYRSGRLLDMGRLTRAAHEAGALVLFDLAHSAGALPVELRAHDVDLAVGCGYKYLNGGPGAPAFLFVAARLQEAMRQPLSGWFGHAAPFAFEEAYRPAAGVARFLSGTPPILSLRALEAGLETFDGVDPGALREKSMRLTQLFIELIEERCAGFGLDVASPRDPKRRGSHVAVRHAEGHAVSKALIARGVIGDFRAPDLMRFGFAPLYNRYVDVFDSVEAMHAILSTNAWKDAVFQHRESVT